MMTKVLALSKSRRARSFNSSDSFSVSLTFEKFYDFMSNIIGGGSSYAPNETKW
jgi:hypothetical protein